MSAAGTRQPAVERSMGRRVQRAPAAAAGVTAGYLGKSGIDGQTVEVLVSPYMQRLVG